MIYLDILLINKIYNLMGCDCKKKANPIPIEEMYEDMLKEKQKKLEMDDFDEDKAKELVKSLLSIDLKFYRSQMYDVINLDSKEFRKLFEGDSDYIYNVKNQESFKKLAIKFENFSILLVEWYKKDKKYHVCLKQLWKNFINIYDLLKDIDDEEKLEKKLKSTNYKNWDEEIKEDFKIIIRNSKDMTEKFKVFLQTEFKELDNVIKELKKTETVIEKTEEKEKTKNFCIKDNINMITDKIIEAVFPIYLNKINTNKKEEYSNQSGNSTNSDKNHKGTMSKFKMTQIIKNITSTYITGEIPKDFNLTEALNGMESLVNQIGCMKYLQPLIKDNLGKIINNDYTAYAIMGLSFLNLCYNIISTYTFLDNSKNIIKEFEQRLDNIKKKFRIHKQEISLLPPDDVEEAMRKIEEIRLNFEKDKYEIEILIQDIEKEINNQESQKNQSFFKIFTNIGMMGLNVAIASNNKNVKYGISAIFNGLSAATDATAIIYIRKNIDELKKLLKEAKEEEKKIEESIKELNQKYKDYQLKPAPTAFIN